MKYILLFLFLPISIFSGSITHTFTFLPENFLFEEKDGYQVISSPSYFSDIAEPGKPILPIAVYSFLLPPDAEIKDVEIISKKVEAIEGNYLLYPGQKPTPLSFPATPFIPPDPVVYNSSAPYPERVLDYVKSGLLAGYRIAGLKVYPLQYIPTERKLFLIKEMKVKINYEEGRFIPLSLTRKQRETFEEEVKLLIENPERLSLWRPQTKDLEEEVDYCIITSAALRPYWAPLKDWKTKKGYKTEVVTTDSIYANYPGRDNQEKIRNFIRDWWQNKGIKWVLLGGDDIIIPDRKARIIAEGNIGNIPTDMYYADLEWSWDSNRNNLFGEMTDSVDLFHDLYIGRAPVDNQTHISIFIKKDTIFEKHPDITYLPSLLLPSGMLFSPYHGRVINNIIAGLFPSGWKIAKLENPSTNQTRDSLNRGYEHCHVAHHGSPSSLSVLTMSQIPGLTNGIKYDIIKGINCDCGSFDGKECIAESLVNYPAGGCVAAMLNSRYGFGYPPSLGPSEMLDLEFYKCLQEGIYQVGVGNCASKDRTRHLALGQDVWRWCVYEHNLFGDPELPMYDKSPQNIDVSHPSSIGTGPQVIRVVTTSGGNPLSSALVCLMGAGIYSVGKTNSLGWVDLFLNPQVTGELVITVTAKNHLPYEGTVNITSGGQRPCITFFSSYIDDAGGNNNQRLDPGETVNLFVTLKNRGDVNATNLWGTLRPLSSFITLIDSTANYGNVNSGDTARGDFYRLLVSPQTPPASEVEFYVHCQSSEGNWQPFFKLTVGEPREAKRVWLDHDTGNIVFTVTSFGGFGSIAPFNEGSGLKYPKDAGYGALCYGGLVVGTDSGYIVDRFYGHPSSTINKDFQILDTLDYLRPPRLGAEEYEATYDDGYHPQAKGLTVQQWSIATSQIGNNGWVILCFDFSNRGSQPINNLYAGLFFDFDVYNTTANIIASDTLRRFIYALRSATSQNPTVGLRLLYPPVVANISAIEHSKYVTPANQMSEAVKDSFLRGFIRVPQGNTSTNWSICLSTGPFDLPVGWRQRVAFAVVGGINIDSAKKNSDSAQSWWEQMVGMAENITKIKPKETVPTITTAKSLIDFISQNRENLEVAIYDATGRRIKVARNQGNGRKLVKGVYFLKLKAAERSAVIKIIVR